MRLLSQLAGGAVLIGMQYVGTTRRQLSYSSSDVKKRAEKLQHKAKVLRQINANKMDKCRRRNGALNWMVFVFTVILTFLSFYGLEKIRVIFLASFIDGDKLGFVYNAIVVIILIFSAVQLAARLGERQIEHLGSVKRLTDFITDVDDIMAAEINSHELCSAIIRDLNSEYRNITASLPENSDREWRAAKKQIAEKGK